MELVGKPCRTSSGVSEPVEPEAGAGRHVDHEDIPVADGDQPASLLPVLDPLDRRSWPPILPAQPAARLDPFDRPDLSKAHR